MNAADTQKFDWLLETSEKKTETACLLFSSDLALAVLFLLRQSTYLKFLLVSRFLQHPR